MGKPSMTQFPNVPPSTSTAEALNANLEALADKFDGNITDSDVSSIAWSLISSVAIDNADIVAGADINLGGVSGGDQKALDASCDTGILADDAVTFAKMASGAVNKNQTVLSTATGPSTTSALTDINSATLTVTGPAASTPILIVATIMLEQIGATTGSHYTATVSQDGVALNPPARAWLSDATGPDMQTLPLSISSTIGTSPEVIKLQIQKNDGNGNWQIAANHARITVIQLKGAD